MPIKYEDPVTGEYFDTESEADFSGMLHREMYFNDDGGAAARARQEMEEELMEQERQRNLAERAWKQYQAKLKEQEERKRWMELPVEQKIKGITDKAMTLGTYNPPSLVLPFLSCFIVVGIFITFLKLNAKIDSLFSLLHLFILIGSIAIIEDLFSSYKATKKRDESFVEELKKIARETKSKALTIELPKPLELEGSAIALQYYIYFAAKYGFEVTNPEFQGLYNKLRKKLMRFDETQDLDWESLWNEKPKETAA